MALIIDATLNGANSNSYVTLIEANEYMETRLHSQVWNDANEDDKNRALVMATRRLGYEKYYGDRETTTQKLVFARVNLDYLDGILLDGIIPEQLKEAQMELALHLLETDMSKIGTDTSSLKKESVSVGSITTNKEFVIDDNSRVTNKND